MSHELDGYADKIAAGAQGSGQWLYERHGNCTGSRFKDVMDFTKKGVSGAKRTAYLMETVIERITGKSAEHFVSDAMQWGTDTEPLARMAYESHTGAMVLVPGYTPHPTIKRCGGSVDGLRGDDGIVEIKCPNTTTHVKTVLADAMPEDHIPQVQGYLWITGRQYCDFISYDPRLPDGLQLFVKRVPRDDDYIAELSAGVLNFLAEVDAMESKLRESIVCAEPDESQDIPPLEL